MCNLLLPSIGSGDGSFNVEYSKVELLGSGEVDLRSFAALYVRGAVFLSFTSIESESLDMTDLISSDVVAMGFFVFNKNPGCVLNVLTNGSFLTIFEVDGNGITSANPRK